MTCYHLKIQKVGDKPWSCVKCGEELEPTSKFSLEAVLGAQVHVDGDYMDIPEGQRYRSPELPDSMSGWDADKMYAKRAADLRDQKRSGHLKRPENMRYAGAIPPEAYWYYQRKDPHFWYSKKNRKKFKPFLVDDD